MKITEFRICLPLSMEEYPVSQMYMVARVSREKSGGGFGIEFVKNEPFEKDGVKGQHTLKHFHLEARAPKFLRAILPAGALLLVEESWKCFPYYRTVYTNNLLGDRMRLTLESKVVSGIPVEGNMLNLPKEELDIRVVEELDIAAKMKKSWEYPSTADPAAFHSEKTNRGPLSPGWYRSPENRLPTCTSYNVVRASFRYFGVQTVVEKYASKVCRDIYLNSSREQFCWIDEYFGMALEDLTRYEQEQASLAIQLLADPSKVVGSEEDDEVEEQGKDGSGSKRESRKGKGTVRNTEKGDKWVENAEEEEEEKEEVEVEEDEEEKKWEEKDEEEMEREKSGEENRKEEKRQRQRSDMRQRSDGRKKGKNRDVDAKRKE